MLPLAAGRVLPARAVGSVLAVDISGFTPLTEALVQAWGERAGADAATRHLNAIYGELTTVINRWGGSVVGFSGDGLLCWLDAPSRQRAQTQRWPPPSPCRYPCRAWRRSPSADLPSPWL
ncbi:MAG: hypothetical protein R2851_18570 [Caldilineaceae bacterium]